MHLVIMTFHSIIRSKSVIIFRTIISEILSDLVNDLGFYKMPWIIFYSRRYIFSTLTVTSKLSILKAHSTHVTIACCLQLLVFLKVESLFHFCDGGHKFFPQVRVIMNLKQFDVLFNNSISITKLYLFYLFRFACFLLKSTEDQYG